jgi:hypothetical protein
MAVSLYFALKSWQFKCAVHVHELGINHSITLQLVVERLEQAL